MEHIYLDNGSTSFPKAPGVGRAMADFIERVGVNIARGGYEAAYSAAEVVLDTRERLGRLFGCSRPEQVIFSSGVTESLNLLMLGFLRPGDRVVTTSMEHNAVMRPLHRLEREGVHVVRVPCESDGTLPLERLEEALTEGTRALVMTHASNVCGTALPVREAAQLCHAKHIRIIVDCAQSGGVLPIDFEGWGLDALAFAGHKSLLGPQGIGGCIITSDFAREVQPVLAGGTGSLSHLEDMPDFLPDRFEPGTQNLPGIFGLNAALRWLEGQGTENILRHELSCTARLLEGLQETDGVRVLGLQGLKNRTAVVSVDFLSRDNAEAAFEMETEFGIQTRCGLHCAPAAHRTLGTFPRGTVRFAPGHDTTYAEIDAALEAIRHAAKIR